MLLCSLELVATTSNTIEPFRHVSKTSLFAAAHCSMKQFLPMLSPRMYTFLEGNVIGEPQNFKILHNWL